MSEQIYRYPEYQSYLNYESIAQISYNCLQSRNKDFRPAMKRPIARHSNHHKVDPRPKGGDKTRKLVGALFNEGNYFCLLILKMNKFK